ncbi:hypothetical protein [Streptomyces sp. NPDC004728]|uniref:hypothetical protein n=1 Tax=Streptomyces sp. NPDC004728 TaxID=3154289 RepID=UPI00339E0C79
MPQWTAGERKFGNGGGSMAVLKGAWTTTAARSIYKVFGEAARHMEARWQWGPTQSQFGVDPDEATANAFLE